MEVVKRVSRVKTLICSCCGKYTKGRQWWNREIGYGICKECVPRWERHYTPEGMKECCGVEGIHYNLNK